MIRIHGVATVKIAGQWRNPLGVGFGQCHGVAGPSALAALGESRTRGAALQIFLLHVSTTMNPHPFLARPAKSVAYTAAQIAAAARISKQAVLKSLADIPAGETIIVRGNEAPAWTFEALPERLREAIATEAGKVQLSISDYLDTACKPWQPEIPLAQISDSCLADARKLRAALLPALQRMGAAPLAPADHVRLGLADYQRAFGHGITERHWRRLMDRTLRRDSGAQIFERLEIYLPEKPACKPMQNGCCRMSLISNH